MSVNLLENTQNLFYWASFFLSKEIFYKCVSLYNFSRTLDDIVDDASDLKMEKEKFFIFKKNFINKDLNNLIIKDMWSLIDSENISSNIVIDLFDGVETDLKEKSKLIQIRTSWFTHIEFGTVGLMMSKYLK